MATKKPSPGAVKALQKELKELSENPVEGFKVMLSDSGNLFLWDIAIFGPPQTIYEGGYFKARISFPSDYPYNPPSVYFLSDMFHPNIYETGEVCISILHSPGEDPQSGELASERWNPTQNVRTILLSVISLLNEPNIHSAAHVDACVSYRKWKDSNGVQDEYERIVRSLVEATRLSAAQDGVTVPTTLEEYCFSGRAGYKSPNSPSEDSDPQLDLDEMGEFYCFDADVDDDDLDDDLAMTDPHESHHQQHEGTDGADSALEEPDSERVSSYTQSDSVPKKYPPMGTVSGSGLPAESSSNATRQTTN